MAISDKPDRKKTEVHCVKYHEHLEGTTRMLHILSWKIKHFDADAEELDRLYSDDPSDIVGGE